MVDRDLEQILDDEIHPTVAVERPHRSRRAAVVMLAVVALTALVAAVVVRDDGERAAPPAGEPEPTTTVPLDEGGTGGGGYGGGYGGEGTWGPPGSLEPVSRRTTAAGIEIRVFRPTDPMPFECPPGEWCPPADCIGQPGIVLELSTEAIVGIGSSYRSPPVVASPFEVGGFGAVGVAESSPVLWAAVAAPDRVVSVSLAFAGALDRADVRGGWAALAVPAPLDRFAAEAYDFDGATVTGYDAAGAVVERAALVPSQGWRLPMRCDHLPALPSPGEQPADVDASRAAVVAAYTTAFDSDAAMAARLAAIERSDGLDALFDEVIEKYAYLRDSLVAETGEIVFTSPTEAALQYRLVYDQGTLTTTVGHAVLVDSTWKVARSTVCAALAQGGVTCP